MTARALLQRLRLALPLVVIATLVLPVAPASAQPGSTRSAACSPVAAPEIPGATVLSVTAKVQPAGTVQEPWGPPVSHPAVCEIDLTLTHPGVGDKVLVRAWLPREGWTGRFQGVGGAGYRMGGFTVGLAQAVAAGYAAATTDGGVGSDPLDPASWALGPDGKVNQGLLTNFASRSLHDMALAGKAITAAHYGRPARYAYWNGCSTGGRQGLMNAQRYPEDYDGVLANAPAINMPEFLVGGDLWAQVVMRQEKVVPSQCEFAAFADAALKACDTLDGVADGVLEQPLRCAFDPAKLIGQRIVCEGKEITIRREVAEVVRQIWRGHPSWFGLPKSASFGGVAHTEPGPDGKLVGVPFAIADNWLRYFVKEDPKSTVDSVSYREFHRLAVESPRRYDRIIASDDPDLSAFRRAGGKMITWHGWTDSIIYPQGTIDYRERVQRRMGGADRVDEFYRFFLAPGVEHCAGGAGPVPVDPLAALVKWVEQGQAPDTLPAATTDASGATVTRNLCRYPLVSHYDGKGDPKAASSYRCGR